MSGPGYALIFNNFNFDGAPNISAGKLDKKAIVKFLECFKIKYSYHEDLTKAEIERVMKKEKMNFSDHSCMIIFILSHGDRTSIISAKDTKYNLEDTIIFSLLRNGSLDEKPKFLFIDTCKGKNTPEKIRNEDANEQRFPGQCVQSQIHDLYIPDYLLIFYSTYEGFVSYCNHRDGSIFTQTLCKYLVKYGHDRSLMYIIEKVMEAVKVSKKTSIISAKDTKYNLEDTIIFSLLRNGSLDEKPKFLFIDTCKGKNTPEKIRNAGTTNVQSYPWQSVKIHDLHIPDYLLTFYSTYEGFVSYYDDKDGSVFTLTLCMYLIKYGHDKNLMDIIEKVMEAVKAFENGKQSPCLTTNYFESYCFGDHLNQSSLFSDYEFFREFNK